MRRGPALLCCTLGLIATAEARPPHTAPLAPSPLGEAIYRQGVLPSGSPLVAERSGGLRLEGAEAACTNCHRRSGLGETEGRNIIPPIAGVYLFHPRGRNADELDLPFVDGVRADRDPYDDATLARAIRDGIAQDGHRLSYLMPHYQLDERSMSELVRYLKLLTPAVAPGVTPTVLHFATVITPDADPVSRQGMLDVLNAYFAEKNTVSRAVTPRLRSARKLTFRVERRWQLHIWQLSGPEGTWEAQLRAHLKAEPVFALISGIGKSWRPIHRFCEQEQLPCLFPNTDLPTADEGNFYPVYFSRGVLLEADLMAATLRQDEQGAAPQRVIQVYRAGDIGKAAAQRLDTLLKQPGPTKILSVTRELSAEGSKQDLLSVIGQVKSGDALVLWLRPKDLAALDAARPPEAMVLSSGIMGGLEDSPLPPSWRAVSRMAYPVDLPDRRTVRLDYPLGWFHIRRIPIVDFKVQADTYLACGLLAETLSHMTDTFVRDYLLERLEDDLDHRIITGYYPRLSLAPRQRFASKGGYLVRFADPSGSRLTAASGWISP